MHDLIETLQFGTDLTSAQMHEAMEQLFSGSLDDETIAQFLLALKTKGETVEELTTAARVMREHMTPFETKLDAIDVCGTGGDAKGTYNISTTVALVVAACGVPVAKHGNRSVSSKSGSSDVLQELGINMASNHDVLRKCLNEANICFLFAPYFHPAVKHVAAARQSLGTRTIFNLLGPLCNPAKVKRQLMGVYDEAWVTPLIQVLQQLGSVSAAVVYGKDGVDELSVTGPSVVAQLADGEMLRFELTPGKAGLKSWPMEALIGKDAKHNAVELRAVLDGKQGAYRDAVLLNAAAALIIAERADAPQVGVALAAEAIDSGRATETLEKLVFLSSS